MSNDKWIINTEELCSLWSVNITKMHFQQNVCFQLRSWTFGITGVVIPLIWAGGQSFGIRVLLHVITILIIGLILHKDLSWHGYFVKYSIRARIIENFIVKGVKVYRDKFVEAYEWEFVKDYKKFINGIDLEKKPMETIPNLALLRSTFSECRFFRLQTDLIELYMILLLLISLIVTIFQHLYNGRHLLSMIFCTASIVTIFQHLYNGWHLLIMIFCTAS